MLVRRFIMRVAIVFVLATLAVPALANNKWSIYHWARTISPFDLITVDSTTSEWQGAFDQTVSMWTASSVLNLVDVQGDESKKFRRRCKPKDGQIVACNLSYGNTGWLGLAGININSAGHIVKGYAKMNDYYSSYWEGTQGEWERNHVVCQELGHLLGLGHTSVDRSSQNTCMDYSNSKDSQWPNDHDYTTLEAIYLHSDSYDTYDTGGSVDEGGGGTNPCNAPPGKGCHKFGFDRDTSPPMGVPVEVGLHHEIWIASDNAGGYWVHHIRTVPEEYRHN